MWRNALRPLLAGSSPSTSTFQCREGAVEQPLRSCGSTPGPDPKQKSRPCENGRSVAISKTIDSTYARFRKEGETYARRKLTREPSHPTFGSLALADLFDRRNLPTAV